MPAQPFCGSLPHETAGQFGHGAIRLQSAKSSRRRASEMGDLGHVQLDAREGDDLWSLMYFMY
jgi:hypothetical protein